MELPCKIGYYRVKVKPKDSFWGGVYYDTFVGRTTGGRTLTDAECRRIMDLPVISFYVDNDTYGERDGISKPRSRNELDEMVHIDAFIRRAAADTDEARKEEIAAATERARWDKSALGREMESLKNELRQIDNALTRAGSVSERVDAEKRKATASKSLKRREQSLFMDGLKIDAEAETAIQTLTDNADLAIEVTRLFVIDILAKIEKGA